MNEVLVIGINNGKYDVNLINNPVIKELSDN